MLNKSTLITTGGGRVRKNVEQNERIENLNAIIAFNAEQINKNFAYIFSTDEILQMKMGMSPIISAEKKIQEESEK